MVHQHPPPSVANRLCCYMRCYTVTRRDLPHIDGRLFHGADDEIPPLTFWGGLWRAATSSQVPSGPPSRSLAVRAYAPRFAPRADVRSFHIYPRIETVVVFVPVGNIGIPEIKANHPHQEYQSI
jgi:hypothetical protein